MGGYYVWFGYMVLMCCIVGGYFVGFFCVGIGFVD